MKARPRSIEREVAKWITELSTPKGYQPVERKPVIGRTGPDIEINELGLVIDVKSRLAVPKMAFVAKGYEMRFGSTGLIGVRIDEIERLFCPPDEALIVRRPPLASVWKWWEHMDEWRQMNYPQGVSALVLHRPGMPVRCCSVVISNSEREKLWKKTV